MMLAPTTVVENFCVPQPMPMKMDVSTKVVSRVSRRMLRKRTMANTAIIPNAVTMLFDSTVITSETMTGVTTRALTKVRE